MSLLISDVIGMGEKQLSDAGIESAKTEAREIYCHLKKIDKMQFFQRWSKVADDGEMESYFSVVERRCKREPLQHIFGEVEFMGFKFAVGKNVLIPRMDTEAVVIQAMNHVRNKGKILDLCCGSGIIGISIAKLCEKEGKKIKLTSVDISEAAIKLTEKNADINKVKVDILRSDLFENKKIKEYNMIVANPPYIPSDDIKNLDIEVREHDPLTALDGGEDGLSFYRKIVEESPKHLKKDGYVVFEIGYNQGVQVAELLKSRGFTDIEITQDLAGRDRVVKGQFKK